MNTEHRQQTLDWYVKLAQTPGWKEYVWHQVKVMASEHPEHHDLPARMVAEMKRLETVKTTTATGL